MSNATTAGTNDSRLHRLRELAATCGEYTNQTYAHILAGRGGEIPAFALLYEHAETSELLLSPTSDILAAIAQDELERDPSYSPKVLVCLNSGEQRRARMPVFFMAAALTLPPLVGDLLERDLAGREDDHARNPERESELERARDLIHGGEPLPEDLYTAVADVIELDIGDSEDDERRNPQRERLLGALHDQLLGRAPSVPARA
jgi:hypothetical protein